MAAQDPYGASHKRQRLMQTPYTGTEAVRKLLENFGALNSASARLGDTLYSVQESATKIEYMFNTLAASIKMARSTFGFGKSSGGYDLARRMRSSWSGSGSGSPSSSGSKSYTDYYADDAVEERVSQYRKEQEKKAQIREQFFKENTQKEKFDINKYRSFLEEKESLYRAFAKRQQAINLALFKSSKMARATLEESITNFFKERQKANRGRGRSRSQTAPSESPKGSEYVSQYDSARSASASSGKADVIVVDAETVTPPGVDIQSKDYTKQAEVIQLSLAAAVGGAIKDTFNVFFDKPEGFEFPTTVNTDGSLKFDTTQKNWQEAVKTLPSEAAEALKAWLDKWQGPETVTAGKNLKGHDAEIFAQANPKDKNSAKGAMAEQVGRLFDQNIKQQEIEKMFKQLFAKESQLKGTSGTQEKLIRGLPEENLANGMKGLLGIENLVNVFGKQLQELAKNANDSSLNLGQLHDGLMDSKVELYLYQFVLEKLRKVDERILARKNKEIKTPSGTSTSGTSAGGELRISDILRVEIVKSIPLLVMFQNGGVTDVLGGLTNLDDYLTKFEKSSEEEINRALDATTPKDVPITHMEAQGPNPGIDEPTPVVPKDIPITHMEPQGPFPGLEEPPSSYLPKPPEKRIPLVPEEKPKWEEPTPVSTKEQAPAKHADLYGQIEQLSKATEAFLRDPSFKAFEGNAPGKDVAIGAETTDTFGKLDKKVQDVIRTFQRMYNLDLSKITDFSKFNVQENSDTKEGSFNTQNKNITLFKNKKGKERSEDDLLNTLLHESIHAMFDKKRESSGLKGIGFEANLPKEDLMTEPQKEINKQYKNVVRQSRKAMILALAQQNYGNISFKTLRLAAKDLKKINTNAPKFAYPEEQIAQILEKTSRNKIEDRGIFERISKLYSGKKNNELLGSNDDEKNSDFQFGPPSLNLPQKTKKPKKTKSLWQRIGDMEDAAYGVYSSGLDFAGKTGSTLYRGGKKTVGLGTSLIKSFFNPKSSQGKLFTKFALPSLTGMGGLLGSLAMGAGSPESASLGGILAGGLSGLAMSKDIAGGISGIGGRLFSLSKKASGKTYGFAKSGAKASVNKLSGPFGAVKKFISSLGLGMYEGGKGVVLGAGLIGKDVSNLSKFAFNLSKTGFGRASNFIGKEGREFSQTFGLANQEIGKVFKTSFNWLKNSKAGKYTQDKGTQAGSFVKSLPKKLMSGFDKIYKSTKFSSTVGALIGGGLGAMPGLMKGDMQKAFLGGQLGAISGGAFGAQFNIPKLMEKTLTAPLRMGQAVKNFFSRKPSRKTFLPKVKGVQSADAFFKDAEKTGAGTSSASKFFADAEKDSGPATSADQYFSNMENQANAEKKKAQERKKKKIQEEIATNKPLSGSDIDNGGSGPRKLFNVKGVDNKGKHFEDWFHEVDPKAAGKAIQKLIKDGFKIESWEQDESEEVAPGKRQFKLQGANKDGVRVDQIISALNPKEANKAVKKLIKDGFDISWEEIEQPKEEAKAEEAAKAPEIMGPTRQDIVQNIAKNLFKGEKETEEEKKFLSEGNNLDQVLEAHKAMVEAFEAKTPQQKTAPAEKPKEDKSAPASEKDKDTVAAIKQNTSALQENTKQSEKDKENKGKELAEKKQEKTTSSKSDSEQPITFKDAIKQTVERLSGKAYAPKRDGVVADYKSGMEKVKGGIGKIKGAWDWADEKTRPWDDAMRSTISGFFSGGGKKEGEKNRPTTNPIDLGSVAREATGGADDTVIPAKKGEAVIPAEKVKKKRSLVDFLLGRGKAKGGIIGGSSASSGGSTRPTTFGGQFSAGDPLAPLKLWVKDFAKNTQTGFLVKSFMNLGNAASNAMNVLAGFTKGSDTFGTLMGSIELLTGEIGIALTPIILRISALLQGMAREIQHGTGFFGGLVKSVTDFINSISAGDLKLLVSIGALAAGITALMPLFGIFSSVIGIFATGISMAMGLLTSPIILLVGGIIGLIGYFGGLNAIIKTAQVLWNNLGTVLTAVAVGIAGWMAMMIAPMIPYIAVIGAVAIAFGVVIKVIDIVTGAFSKLADWAKSIFGIKSKDEKQKESSQSYAEKVAGKGGESKEERQKSLEAAKQEQVKKIKSLEKEANDNLAQASTLTDKESKESLRSNARDIRNNKLPEERAKLKALEDQSVKERQTDFKPPASAAPAAGGTGTGLNIPGLGQIKMPDISGMLTNMAGNIPGGDKLKEMLGSMAPSGAPKPTTKAEPGSVKSATGKVYKDEIVDTTGNTQYRMNERYKNEAAEHRKQAESYRKDAENYAPDTRTHQDRMAKAEYFENQAKEKESFIKNQTTGKMAAKDVQFVDEHEARDNTLHEENQAKIKAGRKMEVLQHMKANPEMYQKTYASEVAGKKKAAAEQEEKKKTLSDSLAISLKANRAQPAYSSIEEAYKKIQVSALGTDSMDAAKNEQQERATNKLLSALNGVQGSVDGVTQEIRQTRMK